MQARKLGPQPARSLGTRPRMHGHQLQLLNCRHRMRCTDPSRSQRGVTLFNRIDCLG